MKPEGKRHHAVSALTKTTTHSVSASELSLSATLTLKLPLSRPTLWMHSMERQQLMDKRKDDRMTVQQKSLSIISTSLIP